MLTRRQILRADSATVPLEEFERAFGFLRVRKLQLTSDEKKQQYLSAFNSFAFLVSAIIPLSLSAILSIAAWEMKEGQIVGKIYYIWSRLCPQEIVRLAQGSSQVRGNVVVVGVTGIIWMSWLVWRIYKDATTKTLFITPPDQRSTQNNEINMLSMMIVLFVISIVFLISAYINYIYAYYRMPVSVNDFQLGSTMSKFALIAYGFWFLGLLSFLFFFYSRYISTLQRPVGRP